MLPSSGGLGCEKRWNFSASFGHFWNMSWPQAMGNPRFSAFEADFLAIAALGKGEGSLWLE